MLSFQTFFYCLCVCVCVLVALGVFGHQDERSGLHPGGEEQMEREVGKGQLCVVHVGAQARQPPPKKSPTPSVSVCHRLTYFSKSILRIGRNCLLLLILWVNHTA